MELSKYVRIVSYNDDESVLVNTFNNAVVLLKKETIAKIRQGNQAQIASNELDMLTTNGFFEATDNVLSVAKDENYEDDILTLTINVTEGCNLHCSYCYQNNFDQNHPIKQETMDQIVAYIDAVFAKTNKKKLSIYFFGGEPTTQRNKIYYLKEKIDGLQEKYGFDLIYNIGTNGVLLKEPLIEKFSHLNVDLAMSNREDHDSYRTFKSGNGTYDLIFKNLKDLAPYFRSGRLNLNLRFNTNETNINHFDEFVRDFKKLNIPAAIMPAYTDNYAYNNYYNKLDKEDFYEWVATDFVNTLIENDQPVVLSFNKGFQTHCRAYEKYSVKFFSDGALALCDVTNYYRRKHVPLDKIIENPELTNQIYSAYKGVDNKNIEKCHGCPLLFACSGDLYCNQDGCVDSTEFNFTYFIKNYVDQVKKGNAKYFVNL